MITTRNIVAGIFIFTVVSLWMDALAQFSSPSAQDFVEVNLRSDTLFPKIVLEPDSFYIVIRPDTTLKKEMSIFNNGDDTLFYTIDANSGLWQKEIEAPESIEGSKLTASPNGYKPGESIDFTFNLYNGSPDNEWLDSLTVNFPEGVSVNFSTNFIGGTLGPLVYNGSSGNGNPVQWNDENGANGGNILPGETATCILNLSFDESFNDTLHIIYKISGDVFGGGPHDVIDTLVLIPEEIWLIANPDTGVILPGEQQLIELNFNSEGIPLGSYNRYFTILSNDTATPVLDVPVKMIVFPSSLTHIINVPEGWSAISTYVVPIHPEFETIFDTVNDKLDVIYNINSQIYWPDAGINTIGNWNPTNGYIVKAKVPLQVKVYGLFEMSQMVQLSEGWNLMPTLNTVPSSTFIVFRDIEDKIDVVREIGGNKVYWPAQGIYTLTQLMPGKAYFIRVTEDCFIIFPPPFK
ncbi:MAG: hypothetical protein K9H16_10830 [Bacteroidales bacterium]|nr:hypothetical protein [Bacteroidales bacterium]